MSLKKILITGDIGLIGDIVHASTVARLAMEAPGPVLIVEKDIHIGDEINVNEIELGKAYRDNEII